MTTELDPEIAVIGTLIDASTAGRAASLDAKAWLRIRDYAISLFEQRAREAQVETAPAAGPPTIIPTAKSTLSRSEASRIERPWHVLGHRRAPRKLDA